MQIFKKKKLKYVDIFSNQTAPDFSVESHKENGSSSM